MTLSLVVCGCEMRTMTEADCTLVKDRLEKAWHRDAIAAQRLADTDTFSQFIRDEGDRIGDAWMEQCKALIGRQVSVGELDCLGKAETIDDVRACAPR